MSKKRKSDKHSNMTKKQIEEVYNDYVNSPIGLPDSCVREIFHNMPNYKEIVVKYLFEYGYLKKILDDGFMLADNPDLAEEYYNNMSENQKYLIQKYHLGE